MFDIGFSELLLIAIVALIVVGPERLPTTLRVLLRYFQKFRAGYQKVREEVERELQLDELRQAAKETRQVLESEMKNVVDVDTLKSPVQELQSSANMLESTARDIKEEINRVPEIYSSVPTEAVAVPAVQMPVPVSTPASEPVPSAQEPQPPAPEAVPAAEVAQAPVTQESRVSSSASQPASVAETSATKEVPAAQSGASSLDAVEVEDDLLDEPPIMTDADLARWKAEVQAMEAATQSKGEGA